MTAKNVADLEVSMMLTNNAIHTHMMLTWKTSVIMLKKMLHTYDVQLYYFYA